MTILGATRPFAAAARRLQALVLLALLAAACGAAAETAGAVLPPGPQLRTEGIPVLLRPAARQVTPAEPTGLRFVAWHPKDSAMLVLARFGGRAQLHLLDAPGARPRPLTRGSDGAEGARFEPEAGEYLVFRRDQGGNEAWRLVRVPTQGGDEVLISRPDMRVADYQFLPQGKGLVYVAERLDRDSVREDDRQAHSRVVWVDPLQPERTRVLADLRGGRFTGLRVGPDGSAMVTRTVDFKSERLLLASLDARWQVLTGSDRAPSADEPVVWSAQALRGEFRHLVRMGTRSGARESLLVDMQADLEIVAAPPPDQTWPLALAHNEDGISVLRLFDPGAPSAGLNLIGSDLAPGVVRALRWHSHQPWLAIEHSSAQSPGRIWVYDLQRKQLLAWTGAGAPPSAEATTYRSLRWTSFDGRHISGLHVAPPARFAGPRPVLISLHGGPASQSRPTYLSPLHRQLVEEEGMHLILPNVRGSEGFGKTFLSLDDGRRREDAVKDVSALLDLVATRADMDAGKVVVEGGSYGGYLSLAVAVHESARIAGSICRVGISNFVTFLEQTESYRRDNRRAEYGDERDPAMREFLTRISPLSRADEVRKPLFVVHGQNDPRVPHNEAEQMVGAVRAKGTPVWFLSAEDEGHSFTRADNRAYLHAATLAFVQRVVQGQPLQ